MYSDSHQPRNTKKEPKMTDKLQEMWDELHDMCGVSEQALQIVTSINGYSAETLRDVMYAVAGTREFDCDY